MIEILITDINGRELSLNHKVKLFDCDGELTKESYPIRLAPTDTAYEVRVLIKPNKYVTLMRNSKSKKFLIVD